MQNRIIIAIISISLFEKISDSTNSNAFVGTSIGGWLVLEPWITPSLFQRFLGKTKSEGVGMDSYTFCEAMGPAEGNRVLKSHWDTWITEDLIRQAAAHGATMFRLPVGDWVVKPQGPQVGCTDGQQEKVTWFLDMAQKQNVGVLLDLHAIKGNANGFDNGGKVNRLNWIDENNFEHWPVNIGEWLGPWDFEKNTYEKLDPEQMVWSIDVIRQFLNLWKDHPALKAIEPVNEPMQGSDLPTLKKYYQDVRAMMKTQAPHLTFVFHDKFEFNPETWNDLFDDDDMDNVAVDTHQQMAWQGSIGNVEGQCKAQNGALSAAAKFKYPVWVGEWSLGTDVCPMWLGGFNDGNTDFQQPCKRVSCPVSYLPNETAVDFDRTAETLGPFGTNKDNTVQNGTCLTDSENFDDDEIMQLGKCTIDTLNQYVAGHFHWTIRNETSDKWNFINSIDKGWTKQAVKAEEVKEISMNEYVDKFINEQMEEILKYIPNEVKDLQNNMEESQVSIVNSLNFDQNNANEIVYE